MAYYHRKKSSTKGRNPTKTLIAKLDKVFSLYIRLRDSRPYSYRAFRCISCNQIKPIDKADCGHYYSRRLMSTRYDEDNCNAECSYCNRFDASHLIGYRDNLEKKIGTQRMELLRLKSAQTKKWSAFELAELVKYYQALIDKMKNETTYNI